jgi:hypothetical protein
MQSQAERLLGLRGRSGHGRRGGGGREELINQYGYDTKYAMHCSRLGFQCVELVTTGALNLPIQGEPASWLLDVRHGRIGFSEWWQRSLELDATMERLETDASIRPGPDTHAIEAWSVETHLRHWR